MQPPTATRCPAGASRPDHFRSGADRRADYGVRQWHAGRKLRRPRPVRIRASLSRLQRRAGRDPERHGVGGGDAGRVECDLVFTLPFGCHPHRIGSARSRGAIRLADGHSRRCVSSAADQLIRRRWDANTDLIVPENDLKFAETEPAPHQFSFCAGDQLLAFAQANGMKMRGHNLVWEQIPSQLADEWQLYRRHRLPASCRSTSTPWLVTTKDNWWIGT